MTKYFSDNDGDASKVQFLLYNKTNGYYVVSDHKNGGTYCVGGSGDAAGTQIGKTASRDKATVFTPDSSGNLSILGLEADVYDLIEIATDDGYKLLSDPVRITIYTAIRQIRAAQAGYVGNDAATHTHTDACKDANGYLICGQMVQETANGRTIGKTAMYVGEVETATAYVDGMETTLATDTANSSENAKVMLEITNTKAYFFPLTGANGTLLFTLAGCAVAIVCISIIMKGKRKENQAD